MNTAPTATPTRKIANPRRTTLVHLKDAESLRIAEEMLPQHAQQLPTVTANPRRTILMTAPAPQAPAAQ
ncbi:hypothetical protein [Streptomyces sp. NPDC049585]|uniref:hypothetical protein n=1 Tax=Streptomyces sp. NPDC049585 TaxID=3155154 RepID=UPI00342F6845